MRLDFKFTKALDSFSFKFFFKGKQDNVEIYKAAQEKWNEMVKDTPNPVFCYNYNFPPEFCSNNKKVSLNTLNEKLI